MKDRYNLHMHRCKVDIHVFPLKNILFPSIRDEKYLGNNLATCFALVRIRIVLSRLFAFLHVIAYSSIQIASVNSIALFENGRGVKIDSKVLKLTQEYRCFVFWQYSCTLVHVGHRKLSSSWDASHQTPETGHKCF